MSRDPDFDPDQFVSGAKMAYEMIVTGFADGDKRALKGLLSREVYENFAAVIDERMKQGEKVQASFVGIEKTEVKAAELVKEDAHITVRFVSQMISATLNKEDEVVDGDLQEVADITDVWTFARPVKSPRSKLETGRILTNKTRAPNLCITIQVNRHDEPTAPSTMQPLFIKNLPGLICQAGNRMIISRPLQLFD